MTINRIALLSFIIGFATMNGMDKSKKEKRILNDIQEARFPTQEQLIKRGSEAFQLDNEVSTLLELKLTEKQRKQLMSLATLKDIERITVTGVVLNQYKNNPEIQKQIRERNQSKNVTSDNRQSLFYGVKFQYTPISLSYSPLPTNKMENNVPQIGSTSPFEMWNQRDSEQK